MSADLPDDQMNSSLLPDMRALDAALREVLNAAPQETASRDVVAAQPEAGVEEDKPLALDETMDVVTRAASAIDELVERNRSITNAAVRSVEFFRAQAFEAKTEAERLREELRMVKEQAEAQRVAAQAQAQELEAELALRTLELDRANAWIGEIRTQVEGLLGGAETRLAESTGDTMFGE